MKDENMSVTDSTLMNLLRSEIELDIKDIERFVDSVFDHEDKNNSSLNEDYEEYDKFAGIVQYIVHDEADNQLKDILDDPANETSKKLRKSSENSCRGRRKRSASIKIPEPEHLKTKRRKCDIPVLNGNHIFTNSGSAHLKNLHNFFPNSMEPATSLLMSAPFIAYEKCPTVDSRPLQVSSAFLPQQIISLLIHPGTNLFICAEVSENSPSKSIPGFPDGISSSNPFSPGTTDLPNLPEEASMKQSQAIETGSLSRQPQMTSELLRKRNDSGHVSQFKDRLKEQYMFRFSFEPLYMDVNLLSSKIDTKTGKMTSKATEKELVIYDMAEQEKETIKLSNLFEDKERKETETKIIAVVGQSGVGKSVLVKKICQRWSAGEFTQFTLVFHFECSKLNICEKQYNLKELLFELSTCPREGNLEIYQYILRHPEKVLLIFDGFDEFQDSESFVLNTFCASPTKKHSAKELFFGLFQKKLLRGCTVLITARRREKFNQHLAKVDQIIELFGFSLQQIECYISEYFKRSDAAAVLKFIKKFKYLFSYCYIPFMCRLVCSFAEENFKSWDSEFNLSLAIFFSNVLKKTRLASSNNKYSTVDPDSAAVDSNHFSTVMDTRDCSAKEGICDLQVNDHSHSRHISLDFLPSNAMIQHFQTAQSLIQLIKGKNFVKYASLDSKKKRNQEICPDLVRRFLVGLLFRQHLTCGKGLHNVIAKKQKKMCNYLRTVSLAELCPQRILELCHCVYESNDVGLIRCTARKVHGELSFMGTRLVPPDVHVLKHVLGRAKSKICLDLRKTGIDLNGLRELMSLKNIKSFRASLSDTVRLMKVLQTEKNHGLLRLCVKKFTIEPFKAESLKDITDLSELVDLQEELCKRHQDSTDLITEIPAVKYLHKITFGLGRRHGQDGFMMLVDILPGLPGLRHLDLNNFNENHIGDKGVEKLAEKFPKMQSLETLDLSQNNITDVGAKKLSAAATLLRSLRTLSLYNNNVGDTGAQHLASILPEMVSLEELQLQCNRITDIGARKLIESLKTCPKIKCLRMYSTTIPHAILQHLQQQDPRISCLSIG
ncbi:MHC class II transactivator [Spea bombifrons]|uniref:MHC class II transactivator n=1 Tax=Spea bombifrons TaxID=233779 RepID=UPI00234B9611|nr:MHC class II transactivator [Spea bombifrons]